jgi:hypothetical protein
MSNLPTLWVDAASITDLSPTDWAYAFAASGIVAREVAYVPKADLDAAREAQRLEHEEVVRLRKLIADFEPRLDFYADDLKAAAAPEEPE